jgi:hypothetical protein
MTNNLAGAARASFAGDYERARRTFITLGCAAGAHIESYQCPAVGPHGEALSMDIAYIGELEAECVLVITSGIHGVEGHAGSAVQSDLLSTAAARPQAGILLVHAVNPFGMAWGCVETQEGIDLNRNFLDFNRPLPSNPFYDEIDAFMCCPARFGPEREAADALREMYLKEHSIERYYAALANGQYHRAGRFSFGGQSPVWSHRVLRVALRKYAGKAKRIALVDVHSGFGNRGEGMVLCPSQAPAAAERARSWWGQLTLEPSDALPYSPHGCLTFSIFAMFPEAEVTSIALEFGTEPPERVIEAMRNGFWLMNFATQEQRQREGYDSRAELEVCFAPRDTAWREQVIARGRQIIRVALTQLSV